MLCIKCRELCGLVDPHRDIDFLHHETVTELLQSSVTGCRLCSIIRMDFDHKRDKPVDASSRVRTTLRKAIGIEVSFDATAADAIGNRQINHMPPVVYVLFQRLDLPSRLHPALKPLEASEDRNTGSAAAFRLASAWLDECVQNHHACQRATSATSDQHLPHRVIDVGVVDGSIEPYLLETDGRIGKYIALSHCWGGGHPLCTTRANIQQHQALIRLERLPRTFRDAIEVTRRLNIRYLWIDSLCIVQDDEKDWEAEAAMMGQYYKQSLLTIAAADGMNSEDGLFRDRERLKHQPCELDIPLGPTGSSQKVYASTNSMSFELKRSSLSKSFKPFPLYSRAWVLQEQILSPRTLTYARDRIAWRCQEMIFDEMAPLAKRTEDNIRDVGAGNAARRGGDPRITDATVSRLQRSWVFPTISDSIRPPQSLAMRSYHQENCSNAEDNFVTTWGSIVQEYTKRSMTYHKDKLIAVQGIADAVGLIGGKSYFAGVWVQSHRSIILGLLWSSAGTKTKDRNRLNVAPSWSWASTTAGVSWPGHWLCRLQPRLDIVDLKMSGTAVKASAELDLKAFVRLGRKDKDHGAVILGWPLEQASSSAPQQMWPLHKLSSSVAFDEHLADGSPIWFAEVVVGETHSEGDQKHLHCLVIIDADSGATYRRVGYSIWQESRWMDPELPGRNMMAVRLI